MQNTTLNVKRDGRKLNIEFWPSSMVKYEIRCTARQIERYLVSQPDYVSSNQLESSINEYLNPATVRRIIADNRKGIRITRTNIYDSKVVTSWSADRKFKFEQENQMVNVINTSTGISIFVSAFRIKDKNSFNMEDFEALFIKPASITPLSTNLSESDSINFQ